MALLSAVTQNRPVVVEIRGVKTSHFKEHKTAALNLKRIGSMRHVECPQSELASNDLQLSRSRMVAATHCPGVGDPSRDSWSVSAQVKTGHFDHRLSRGWPSKTSHFDRRLA